MKKLFALILSLCLVLCLAACGEPSEDTGLQSGNSGNSGNSGHTDPVGSGKPDPADPTDPTDSGDEEIFLWDEAGTDETATILVDMLYQDLEKGTEYRLNVDVTDKGQILSVTNEENNQQAQVEYDAQGFPTAIKVTEDGAVVATMNFTFDATGNLLTAESPEYEMVNSYTYDEKGNVLTYTDSDRTITYTYDENGNTLSAREENKNGKLWEYSYTYDAEGSLLTQQTVKDGELWSSRENVYENGKLVSEKDNSGTEYRYTYDDQGNQLTYEYYKDGEFVWNQSYEYDADGNCTAEYSDGELQSESVYADGGRHVTTTNYHQGYMVSSVNEYTYDENGNELSQIRYNSEKEATRQWTSSYKTFSFTEAQAKVFDTLMENLDELDLLTYDG